MSRETAGPRQGTAFSLGQFLSGIVVTMIAAPAGGLPQALLVLSAASAILMGLALVWAKAAGRDPSGIGQRFSERGIDYEIGND